LTSILLPLDVFDERRAINRISIWVTLARHQLPKAWSREWLESTLRRYLRDGSLSIAEKAVEAADKGDKIADAALREIGAELQMPLLQGLELASGHLQIIAYLQRATKRAPHKRKRGRSAYDDWYRNIVICILIHLASAEFDVSHSRSRESRRAGRQPSGISLVTAALARNRIFLDETSVQKNIWFGLPGALVGQLVAEGVMDEFFRILTIPSK
jgi:hypothetical protein